MFSVKIVYPSGISGIVTCAEVDEDGVEAGLGGETLEAVVVEVLIENLMNG